MKQGWGFGQALDRDNEHESNKKNIRENILKNQMLNLKL